MTGSSAERESPTDDREHTLRSIVAELGDLSRQLQRELGRLQKVIESDNPPHTFAEERRRRDARA